MATWLAETRMSSKVYEQITVYFCEFVSAIIVYTRKHFSSVYKNL